MAQFDYTLTDYQRHIRAFTIFSEYEPDGYVSAEHDVIYAGPDADSVSAEHIAELQSYGWRPDENGGFYHFT